MGTGQMSVTESKGIPPGAHRTCPQLINIGPVPER